MDLDVTHDRVPGRQENTDVTQILRIAIRLCWFSFHVGPPVMLVRECMDLPVWVCFGMIMQKDPASLRSKMRGINIYLAWAETKLPKNTSSDVWWSEVGVSSARTGSLLR